MKHRCASCQGEFSDEAPSSSPAARVFCVFCGKQLPSADDSVPFSADFPREEGFALGVIGTPSAGFPDTLRQFRAHGAAKSKTDSLRPVSTELAPESERPRPRRLRPSPFWASLGVGFAVGAIAALLLGIRAPASAPRAAAPPPTEPVKAAAAPIVLPACSAVASAAPPAKVPPKPSVTPVLERRFWLERARGAQRQYRLEEAERFYRRVLAQAPRDSEALTGLGELALLSGSADVADARFREALDVNADYVPALVARADLSWQSGQTEAAREAYRSLVDHYSADLYPPYVTQRLSGDTCAPQCR